MQNQEKKELKIISLFSGCGGLDMGFHLAKHPKYKFEVIWANDIFESACETFKKNFKLELYKNPKEDINKPSIYLGDISSFNFKSKLGDKRVEGVIGGFPCQDFSVLRGQEERGGINVKRGRLYMHFVRALIELQPKFFVAENVKGLVSSNKGEAFKRIINDFENLNIFGDDIEKDCGYKIEKNGVQGYHIIHKRVVDFSKMGVPQKRERLIIIGIRKDLIADEQKEKYEKRFLSLYDDTEFGHFPLTPLEVFSGKPLDKLNGGYIKIMKEFEDPIKKINSDRKNEFFKNIWSNLTFDVIKDYEILNNVNKKEIFDNAMRKHWGKLKQMGYIDKPVENTTFYDNSQNLFNELGRVKDRMNYIPPGENFEFVKGTEHQVSGMMSNIYKRIHPLRPSPTVIASGGGGTWGYHYAANRQRLTNRERARIQTFPDWFMFKGTASEIRTQIGNAVPPFGVKPFAEELLRIFDEIIS